MDMHYKLFGGNFGGKIISMEIPPNPWNFGGNFGGMEIPRNPLK